MTHAWQPPGSADIAPGRSILIIEDNETLALGLRTSLEVEGYKVECITDGNDGLAWLEQHDPDLIVLDLMLPGMNGFEVLRRYRARGGTAAVLILSARDQEVDKVQGFRIGADESTGAPGWEIDDIAVSGITDTPFSALAPNALTCPRDDSDDQASVSQGLESAARR